MDVIREFRGAIPILGVCLGHQSIGAAYGASIVPAARLMHGKVSEMEHDGAGVFRGLPNPFPATRYHSLAIDAETLPPELEVTCRSEDGEIMGVRAREGIVEGVQFHPESILSPQGKDLLANFLELAGASPARPGGDGG